MSAKQFGGYEFVGSPVRGRFFARGHHPDYLTDIPLDRQRVLDVELISEVNVAT